MNPIAATRRLAAEALGTAILVATVAGSGIMAENLSRDIGVQLLANTISTGAILVVLIAIFAPVSGAHFNPVVSMVFWLRGEQPAREALGYAGAQIAGAVAGVVTAHLMFDLPIIDFSQKVRSGPSQWFSEGVATFGLLLTILLGARVRGDQVNWLVGLYITAAYWFTASTSFANPAVAIARSLTNTFSGIRPLDVPAFVIAQIAGALVALAFVRWLLAGQDATQRLPKVSSNE